jgi:hypothetical protein
MTMKSFITRQFKIRSLLVAGVCSVAFVQNAAAQFVPRSVTIFAAPGTNFGGADTARSAELRSLGRLYEGQGAYLYGVGSYLQGRGQYEISHQTANSMAIENQSLLNDKRRYEKHEREKAEATRLANARATNEMKLLARMRDNPAESNIASGKTLNFLWERLGTRVELLAQRGGLKDLDLSQVRLQTARGMSLESLSETIALDGRVQWPVALKNSELSDLRREIDYAMTKATQADAAGKPATEHYQAALRLVSALQKKASSRLAREGMAT